MSKISYRDLLIGATDAILGALVSYTNQNEIHKGDIAWLMYFISDSLKESIFENAKEPIFLHGILQNLKEESLRKTEKTNINQLYSFIKREKNTLKSEFDYMLFNDIYIIDSTYNSGIDFISNIIKKNNEESSHAKDLFNRDKSEKDTEVIHATYLKKNTSNLFIFIIILITACLNNISCKDKFDIFLRLNLFFKPEFRDYLVDRYQIYRDSFFTASTEPNEYVRKALRYIFRDNYDNSVENDLFHLTSRMFHYWDNYDSLIVQSRSKLKKVSKNDIHVTKDELKFAVAYWLLGNEDVNSFFEEDLGSKFENFCYWIKQASIPNLNRI